MGHNFATIGLITNEVDIVLSELVKFTIYSKVLYKYLILKLHN